MKRKKITPILAMTSLTSLSPSDAAGREQPYTFTPGAEKVFTLHQNEPYTLKPHAESFHIVSDRTTHFPTPSGRTIIHLHTYTVFTLHETEPCIFTPDIKSFHTASNRKTVQLLTRHRNSFHTARDRAIINLYTRHTKKVFTLFYMERTAIHLHSRHVKPFCSLPLLFTFGRVIDDNMLYFPSNLHTFLFLLFLFPLLHSGANALSLFPSHLSQQPDSNRQSENMVQFNTDAHNK